MSGNDTASPLRFVYTNYKGETALRTVRGPITMHFKATQHHHEPQWIMNAFCLDRNEWRSFAMRDCDFVAPGLEALSSDLIDITRLRGNNYRMKYYEAHGELVDLQATVAQERKAHEKDLASWEENYAALKRRLQAATTDLEKAPTRVTAMDDPDDVELCDFCGSALHDPESDVFREETAGHHCLEMVEQRLRDMEGPIAHADAYHSAMEAAEAKVEVLRKRVKEL